MMAEEKKLAIASVPMQKWGSLYDQDEALRIGTIFKDLNMPFFAAEGAAPADHSIEDALKDPDQKNRESRMKEIQEVSFVLDDLRLYLDTHPEDKEGLNMLKSMLIQRKKQIAEFAAECYPLTPDCMADIYEKEPDISGFCWQEGPAPWEGACV